MNLAETILGTDGPQQRRAIAKAITLLESTRADHRAQADALLTGLLPHTGKSFRLGISGVPTFIIGRYMVVGAQPYEMLERALELAKQQEEAPLSS